MSCVVNSTLTCSCPGASTLPSPAPLPANSRGPRRRSRYPETSKTSTLSAFGTLAPPLMGYLIQQGGFELKDVLLWTVSSFYAVSAVFFFFVGESIKRDRKLKEA